LALVPAATVPGSGGWIDGSAAPVIDQQSAVALVEPWETVIVVPSSDPSVAFQAKL
jgi:hypothetical protein